MVENLQGMTEDGESYHGYWAQDIYEVNTNFGSAADLVALSDALHARGMVPYYLALIGIQMLKFGSILWSTLLQITWVMKAAAIALTILSSILSTRKNTITLSA